MPKGQRFRLRCVHIVEIDTIAKRKFYASTRLLLYQRPFVSSPSDLFSSYTSSRNSINTQSKIYPAPYNMSHTPTQVGSHPLEATNSLILQQRDDLKSQQSQMSTQSKENSDVHKSSMDALSRAHEELMESQKDRRTQIQELVTLMQASKRAAKIGMRLGALRDPFTL